MRNFIIVFFCLVSFACLGQVSFKNEYAIQTAINPKQGSMDIEEHKYLILESIELHKI
jgi:hypothetical protein